MSGDGVHRRLRACGSGESSPTEPARGFGSFRAQDIDGAVLLLGFHRKADGGQTEETVVRRYLKLETTAVSWTA